MVSNVAAESARGTRAVEVGSWVRVRDGDLEESWRIVASHEADALRYRMSEDSPMARALLGRRGGERVRVRRPGGHGLVTILGVD